MSDISSTPDPTDDRGARARTLANKALLNQLTSKVTTDAAADLTEALKQQSVLYPALVQSLTTAALSHDTHRRSPSPVREPVFTLTNDSADITHVLTDGVVAMLASGGSGGEQLTSSLQRLPQASVDRLNHLLREGGVLHALHENWVVGINENIVVKIGSAIDPDHINNLQYINDHAPGVPSPRFHGALRGGSLTYIFLSRARGVTLESVWSDLTNAQKLSVQQQLVSIFQLLRAVPPRNDQARLGSFRTGICKDMRRWQRESPASLSTEAELNDFLCQGQARASTSWISMTRSSMREDHRIVMTHGDLHPRNIMVETQGEANDTTERCVRVTSILDWELAGWYPEHWEFVRALNTIDVRSPLHDWIDYLPTEAIGKYPMEYALDCLISRWLG